MLYNFFGLQLQQEYKKGYQKCVEDVQKMQKQSKQKSTVVSSTQK